MRKDDIHLFSRLITETYSTLPESDQAYNPGELNIYFEKKQNEIEFSSIKKYLMDNQVEFETLEYNHITRCFILRYDQMMIDFPSNWSTFSKFVTTGFEIIEEETDTDFLLDIFSELRSLKNNILLLQDNEMMLMIFLEEHKMKEHLSWIRDYLDKHKAIQDIKKAA